MTLAKLRSCVQPVWVALWMLWADAVAAQAPQLARAHLQLDAPSSCTTESALVGRVHLRSRNIQFVNDAGGVPVFQISIRMHESQQVAAELRVAWPDGRRSERRLLDTSCTQAVDALALLIALTLDESAHAAGATNQHAVGDAADSQPGSGVGPAQSPTRGAPASTQAPEAPAGSGLATPATKAGPEPSRLPPAAAGEELWRVNHLAIGIAGELVSGAAPQLLPGLGARFLVAFGSSGPWAPLLQLEAAHAFSAAVSERGGRAKFQLNVARLDVCALGFSLGPVSTRGCLASELGWHSARGEDTYSPASRTRLWAGLGALLLSSIQLSHQLEIDASAALSAPLRRDAYAFRPNVFFRVAALGLHLRLGLGWRFP